jgi:2-methylcitrate dehydratase PrpD
VSSEKMAVEMLSENILNTRFEDIDQETVENTKRRILDVIGDMIGGTAAAGNAELVKIVEGWGGKKEATIFGYGAKVTAHNAAMVNSILCRSFDWEPLVVIVDGKRYPSHSSCTTVPTALTLGESKGISGKDLIAALVVGDDLAARLTAAREHPWNVSLENRLGGTEHKSSPSVSLGSVTTFGATAIAGRLLGLNPRQMKNAFGVAMDDGMGGGGGLWDGATSFKLSQGTTARNGIFAAMLARAGWVGMIDPLFGRSGFYGGQDVDYPDILTRDLGKKYYVETVIKPYPGGRPTHVPIDAALALHRKYKINTEDIDEVVLHLSLPAKYGHYMKPYKVGDYPTGDALFSYKFSTASALVRKNAVSQNYTEEYIRDPRVQDLIGKIKLGDSDKPRGAELELKMKDGQILSEYVPEAIGEIDRPLSRDFIMEKFMTQVEFSGMVSGKNAEKIIEIVDKLEEIDDISRITELAVKK